MNDPEPTDEDEIAPCEVGATLCGGPSFNECWSHAAIDGRCYRQETWDAVTAMLRAVGWSL